MHMADALLSPVVGSTMWAATAGAIAYSSHKMRDEADDRKAPMMGVLGAFLFAAQMINFTIPATGSSGHLGGGMLLAILLGPYASFLTIASVLFVQALFFADGGLLALGCNVFNIGFLPAFVVYPLLYSKTVGSNPGQKRRNLAIILSCTVALQLGAFAVVLETVLSGVSSLQFTKFVLLMQPIHLAVGLIEGCVTAAIVSFVFKAKPEIIGCNNHATAGVAVYGKLLVTFLAAAMLIGGVVSWFASSQPDGLEWAIKQVTGKQELEAPKDGLHGVMAALQEKTSFLPGYSFRRSEESKNVSRPSAGPTDVSTRLDTDQKKDGGKAGTSLSGTIGGIITLLLAAVAGIALKRRTPQA